MIDVVVAGAGPNGLMLAIELRLAGANPVVLEPLPEPSRIPRANGLVGQVIRMLDRRGLYGPLSGTDQPPQPTPGYVFGAMPLAVAALPDNPLYVLPVPQLRIEQVLNERAAEVGVEVRRGHRVIDLAQDADGVDVTVDGPDGEYRLRAGYLVGADGGHSTVRKLAGIGFPGVSHDDTVSRTAHVRVPDALLHHESGGLDVPGYGVVPPFLHHRTESGVISWAPFPGREPMLSTLEWDVDGVDADAPLTLDELRASVRRVLGVDLPMSPPPGDGPHLMRRLIGGNTRLAETYRDRRVLLLGDAAHVHSGIGGPGLNLGLQDAINLGWKLAATARRAAPEDLLDTYESERRQAAERVVMHTQAQHALSAAGPEVTALRVLFAELLGKPANIQHIADMMAGADIRYSPGDHPLVGRWCPDLTLRVDGAPVRLAELARTARPLLLDLTPDGVLGKETGVDTIVARPETGIGVTALLLRPDTYVAWASDAPDPDRESLRAAVARWFGVMASNA